MWLVLGDFAADRRGPISTIGPTSRLKPKTRYGKIDRIPTQKRPVIRSIANEQLLIRSDRDFAVEMLNRWSLRRSMIFLSNGNNPIFARFYVAEQPYEDS